MNQEDILKNLIKIDSTEGKEHDMVEYLDKLLTKTGYKTFRQKLPSRNESGENYNLIATKGTPKLFFFGHTDTVNTKPENWKVTDPWTPLVKEGNLYGLGAVDMKGGIAAALAAAFATSPDHLGFAFTCDEEYKFEGIKGIIESNYFQNNSLELAVFAEPTDLKIINTHRGCLELDIEVLGKSAHAAHPEGGKDASLLYKVLATTAEQLKTNYGHVSFNIGLFVSGSPDAINKVPEYAHATIDIRPSQSLADAGADMVRSLITSNIQNYGLKLKTLTTNFDMKPLHTSQSQVHLLETILREKKMPVEYADLGGTSEAGELNFNYNIPSINFGPGPKQMAHKDNEYVTLHSLQTCTEVFKALITRLQ